MFYLFFLVSGKIIMCTYTTSAQVVGSTQAVSSKLKVECLFVVEKSAFR